MSSESRSSENSSDTMENNYDSDEYDNFEQNDNIEYNTTSINFNDIYNRNINIFNPIFSTIIYNLNLIQISEIMDYIEQDFVDTVLQISLEESKTVERNNNPIDFNIIKYEDIENKEDNKECSICLVDYENEDDISMTNCKHVFHNKCIVEWSRYKDDCPICRFNLKNDQGDEQNNNDIPPDLI